MKLAYFALIIISLVSSKDLQIKVNNDALEDVYYQLKDFGEDYMKKTGPERQELMKQVADAWKNTAAKIILNFGKTVAPVIHNWAELMKEVQVNDNCDQECAVKCLDPTARNFMFFNQSCLQSCNCKFNIYSLDKAKYGQLKQDLNESARNASQFMSQLMKQNQMKVKPALDKYLQKESELYDEFADILKNIALDTFDCDKQCIEDCLKQDFVTFWEIPQCVKHCDCKQHIFEIKGGSLNIPKLMLYNDYDLEAWSTLKLYQHEIL